VNASNHLGEYIKARRHILGLAPSTVAKLLGYSNVNKGCRRLHHLEDGRQINKDFLVRLTGLLGIETHVIQYLIDRDRQEDAAAWEKWADEPVSISVAMRVIPGVIAGVRLPDDVTTPDQAISFGRDLAARLRKKVFIVLSRRETVGITEKGEIDGSFQATPDHDTTPTMRLGKKKYLFHLDTIGNVESADQ
jgi:hypothetical protein